MGSRWTVTAAYSGRRNGLCRFFRWARVRFQAVSRGGSEAFADQACYGRITAGVLHLSRRLRRDCTSAIIAGASGRRRLCRRGTLPPISRCATPIPANAGKTKNRRLQRGRLRRMSSPKGTLEFGSYLGGGGSDEARGIAIDDGAVYLAGAPARPRQPRLSSRACRSAAKDLLSTREVSRRIQPATSSPGSQT